MCIWNFPLLILGCCHMNEDKYKYICNNFLKGKCTGPGWLSKKCQYVHPPKGWNRPYIWTYSTPFREQSNNAIKNKAVSLEMNDVIEKNYRNPCNNFYG